MQKVDLDFNYIVEDNELDITVEVYYRCFFAPGQALYPMEVLGSIYKGQTLEEFKQRFKAEYEKDYEKVEIVDVFIDQLQIPPSKN